VGGYDHNAQLQRHLDPHPVVRALGHRGVDGGLFAEAMALGAGFVNNGGQILSPVAVLPDGNGRTVFFAREIAFPGSIVVNQAGQRFTDDSFTWGLSQAMAAFDHNGGGFANTPAYFVFDHEWKMKYRIAGIPPGELPEWLPTARTPEGLGRVMGIDSAQLATTVKRFNADASKGVDPVFQRGSTGYARTAGDPSVRPNPCLRPLEGPLYGLPLEPGSMGTLSGLLVDANGCAKRHDGSRINGLYFAGNTMASLVEGNFYSGGMANARGVVFGYLSALAATRA
jgi:3-oxosteroid 1-dehydrogenase